MFDCHREINKFILKIDANSFFLVTNLIHYNFFQLNPILKNMFYISNY
jgi:hypothetical protein